MFKKDIILRQTRVRSESIQLCSGNFWVMKFQWVLLLDHFQGANLEYCGITHDLKGTAPSYGKPLVTMEKQ